MKIERISENSIRCTLTSFDLSVRDLNIGELAYGTDKVKKLFTEMMTRASNEVGFETDGTPIMIEAIPLTNDSIQLVITKVNDPEELDARFSRFSPGLGSQGQKGRNDDWLHKLTSELLEGASGFLQQMHQLQAASQQARGNGPEGVNALPLQKPGPGKPGEKPEDPVIPEHSYRAIGFDDLNTIFEAAKAASFYDGDSTLYKKPGTTKYVLLIHGTKDNHLNYAKACNVLAEYGYSINTTPGTGRYYEEHYQVISKSPAIARLSQIKSYAPKKEREN